MDENENKKEVREEVELNVEETKTQEQKTEENNISKETPKFEQLEDVEFEKEQEAKKEKNGKAKKIILIILAIILIAGIGLAVFFVVKMGSPEKTIEDFVGYFNSGDFENVMGTMDLKGFYAISMLGLENSEGTVDYTKFDSKYAELKDTDDCKDFIDTLSKIDKASVKEYFKGYTLKITSMKEPVKIQNTEALYKITANVDLVSSEGETSSDEAIFYVAKIDGKYKIVNGDLPGSVIYAMILLEYQNIAS